MDTRGHARRLPVNTGFGLAKGGATTALQRPSHVVRDTGIPEFVVALALRDDIEVGSANPKTTAKTRLKTVDHSTLKKTPGLTKSDEFALPSQLSPPGSYENT